MAIATRALRVSAPIKREVPRAFWTEKAFMELVEGLITVLPVGPTVSRLTPAWSLSCSRSAVWPVAALMVAVTEVVVAEDMLKLAAVCRAVAF